MLLLWASIKDPEQFLDLNLNLLHLLWLTRIFVIPQILVNFVTLRDLYHFLLLYVEN